MPRSPLLPLLLLLVLVLLLLLSTLTAGLSIAPDRELRGGDITDNCLQCICQARGCDNKRGCHSGACGPFYITEPYFRSSNVTERAPTYHDKTYETCATDFHCARATVYLYLTRLASDCDQNGIINCDDMMLSHYYGIEGCIGINNPFSDDWQNYRECIERVYGLFP